MIEPVYIEAEQTKNPTLARLVLAQLLPDDRKIERASSLNGAEDLLAGAPARTTVFADHEVDSDRSVAPAPYSKKCSGNTRPGISPATASCCKSSESC